MHYAVLSGDFHCVLSLLDKETINRPNNEGITPLMLAIDQKLVDIAELLVRFGADTNCRDTYKRTPLSMAVTAVHRKKEDLLLCKALIELLLMHGADRDAYDTDEMTALMHATDLDRLSFVELLLRFYADTEMKNKKGESALSLAKKRSYTAIAHCIEKHIQEKHEWLRECAATELMYAVFTGNENKVKKMLASGADSNEQGAYGHTALFFAVETNNIKLLQQLLETDADPRLTTPYKYPLYQYVQESTQIDQRIKLLVERHMEKYAASFKEKEQKEKIVLQEKLKALQSDLAHDCLTQAGREALSILQERKISKDGCTPFLYAVREKKYNLVEQMIKEQFVSYALDDNKRDALSIACDNEDLIMIKLLFNHGIPKESTIEQCFQKAMTTQKNALLEVFAHTVPYVLIKMLYNALSKPDKECVEFLLEHSGLQLDEVQAGELLVAAVQRSTTAIIDLIIACYPATVMYANGYGETALMIAAKVQREDVITRLYNAGASLESRTTSGRTVFDYTHSKSPVFMLLQKIEQAKVKTTVQAQEREHIQKTVEGLRIQGYSALMIAAHYNDDKAIENDITCDVNCATKDGTTALMIAAQKGHLEAIRALVKKQGCNKNQKDNQGLTALMYAVLNKHHTIAEELVRSGVAALIVDNNQRTAFDMLNLKLSAVQMEELFKVASNIVSLKATATHIKELLLAAEVGEIQAIIDSLSEDVSTVEKEKRFDEINARTPFNFFRTKFKETIIAVLLNNGHLDSVEILLKKTDHLSMLKTWNIEMQDESAFEKAQLLIRYGAPVTWRMLLNLIQRNFSEDTIKFLIEYCHESVSENRQLASNVLVELCRRIRNDFPGLILHRLLHINNVKGLIELLVKKGVSLNCCDETDGITPLLAACMEKQDELITFLLDAGADVNMADKNDGTPLMVASQAGRVPLVRFFLKKGARVNCANNEGNTALHLACFMGHTEVVKLLLQAGADVSIKNNMSGNAFRIAIDRKTNEIARLLFSYYPSVDKNDHMWRNIFWNVSCRGNEEVVEFLLSHGLDMDSCDEKKASHILFAPVLENRPDMVRYFLDRGASANVKLPDGRTPLTVACDKNHEDIVILLLARGALINAVTKDNYSALTYACTKGHERLARFLIAKGADVHTVDKNFNPLISAVAADQVEVVRYLLSQEIKDTYKAMAFVAACHLGNYPIIKLLLEAEVSPNSLDKQGNPVLIRLCTLKDTASVVELLIKYGVNVNKAGIDKNTPLLCAAASGCADTVEHLLKAGAHVNIQGVQSCTALITASSHGFLRIVNSLLKYKADVNIQEISGNTALMHAAMNNRKEVVQVLLQHGADCSIKNNQRKDALTLASELKHKEIQALLLEHIRAKKK